MNLKEESLASESKARTYLEKEHEVLARKREKMCLEGGNGEGRELPLIQGNFSYSGRRRSCDLVAYGFQRGIKGGCYFDQRLAGSSESNTKETSKLIRPILIALCDRAKLDKIDLNRFDIRLFDFLLGNSDSQHSILHCSLHLIYLRILRQPEPPEELPAAAFHPVPRVVLVFLLHIPLSADLQHSSLLDLHLHLLLLKPWYIGLEHVSLRSFFPVNSSVNHGRSFLRDIRDREREVFERIPHVHGEWVENVAPPTTKQAWNHSHFSFVYRNLKNLERLFRYFLTHSITNRLSFGSFLDGSGCFPWAFSKGLRFERLIGLKLKPSLKRIPKISKIKVMVYR
ncbi:hypothetical protein F8388_002187 [Cannabis sativa]|uniref:Uncharacterized protein n=1 Tax=Cannabis sativa TaxID=3483 RepID=A0A7J6FX54_CANSA|nr:hypothetical protein F8388_002187 [Cannabis sativa]